VLFSISGDIRPTLNSCRRFNGCSKSLQEVLAVVDSVLFPNPAMLL
jgi:hypothetical protein